MNTNLKHIHRLFSLLSQKIIIGVSAFLLALTAYGNPVLNNVSSGNVTIQQTPSTTTVNQSSQKAIINWQSFNIGQHEATHFQQPAGGIALNRISPTQGASQIYGRLTATGQIILMNPAGIFFGPTAFVNVGGLVATTHNISDANFLAGNFQFTKVEGFNGAIVNEGTIVAAQHGLVALVAPGVVNNGKIEANLGRVVLASGDAFTINFAGDNLINFQIDTPTSRAAVDHNGNTLRDGVTNTGAILADGGKVIVSAKAASGVLDRVINMEGMIQAKSVSQNEKGEITFSGDPNGGVVRIASNVNASGKGNNAKGGNVDVTGYNILIDDGATIDVSGDIGGGNINIGGNYQGKGPLPNANAVVMAPTATLLADAGNSGDGGNIILWSDNLTKAYGNISARGGLNGGNGGFIETSSKG